MLVVTSFTNKGSEEDPIEPQEGMLFNALIELIADCEASRVSSEKHQWLRFLLPNHD